MADGGSFVDREWPRLWELGWDGIGGDGGEAERRVRADSPMNGSPGFAGGRELLHRCMDYGVHGQTTPRHGLGLRGRNGSAAAEPWGIPRPLRSSCRFIAHDNITCLVPASMYSYYLLRIATETRRDYQGPPTVWRKHQPFLVRGYPWPPCAPLSAVCCCCCDCWTP